MATTARTFEDLLQPKPPPCRTCSFIESLPKAIQAEVDEAMAKARYGDQTLARALATYEGTARPPAPGDTSVHNHREKGHRR